MTGVVLFSDWYDTDLCRACPDLLFVFGDNLRGFGKGGQAIIRSEPNAVGVPTKRRPAMTTNSFFCDESEKDLDAVLYAIEGLWDYVEEGRTIVVPVTWDGKPSLGLERAKLPQLAPKIYETICLHINEMCAVHGSVMIGTKEELIGFAQGN